MTEANPNTQPLAVPRGDGHYPAGWVSPAEHEAAQRAVHGLAVDLEKAAKEAAEREAEIDRRVKAALGQPADEASAE
jgi:hypothetical protein